MDGLIKLKDIGAQKIHEKTHISRQHVQAILHESFEDGQKVQFIGFISILEREYSVDLSDLKARATEYFDDIDAHSSAKNQVFVVPKKKKKFTALYISIVIIIFIGVSAYSILTSTSAAKTQNIKVQELNQEKVQEILEIVEDINETNSSLENNESTIIVEEEVVAIEVPKSLIVLPRTKVWMGYIDLETHKKYQKVFKNKFTLDTSKNWIIVFGHGSVNIEIDGELKKFNNKNNLRFLYQDGELKKITYKEFKRLNKGRKW